MIKVLKFFVLSFICMFIITPDIYAFSVCEMSDEYKRWLELSDEERALSIEPPYCESTYKNQYTAPSLKKNSNISFYSREDEVLKAHVAQSRYNAVESGYVTSVKNQADTYSCWTFATNSLVETAAIKEGLSSYDLSEKHLEYAMSYTAFSDTVKPDGLYRNLNDGGNSMYSSSYYFRHEGPILETTMPFTSPHVKIAKSSFPTSPAVLDIDEYEYEYFSNYSACSTLQIESIKERIIKYGSAGASMYYSDTYLKGGKYYNYVGNLAANHAVVIVGWDDNIAVSNFGTTPSTSGAWIVKNSWGTSFGDNGYLYISYGDTKICGNTYNYRGVTINDYDKAYYSSEFMSSYSINLGNSTNYVSTKFTKGSEKEFLDKVSIEVITGNYYEVYLSLSNSLNSHSDWKLLGKGTASYDGIVSVKFDPIEITSDYTIIVKRVGTGYFIPLMCKAASSSSRYYRASISSGLNYYSNDGTTWADTSLLSDSTIKGCEPVIYAYTKLATSGTASFTIDSITTLNNKVYAQTDDNYLVRISTENIQSYELFDIIIYNSSNSDVTTNFDIMNNIQNGNVVIKMTDDVTAGTYKFRLKYGSAYKDIAFTVQTLISTSTYTIEDGYIFIRPKTAKLLTKDNFLNNLDLHGNSYRILNSKGADITSTTSTVGTGMEFVVDGRSFFIVLIADINGDGRVKSDDALIISRNLVNLKMLLTPYNLAADVNGDGKIKSDDPMLISRFLVGLKGSI